MLPKRVSVCVRKTMVRRQGKVRSTPQIFSYSVWLSYPPGFPTSAAGCCLWRHAKMMKTGNLSFCFWSLEPCFVARQVSIMPFWLCLYLWNQTCCLQAFPNPKALRALPWKVQLVRWQLQKHFKGWEAKQESGFWGLLLLLSSVWSRHSYAACSAFLLPHIFTCRFGSCSPSASLPWQLEPLLPRLWARQGGGPVASWVRDHGGHASGRPVSFWTAPGWALHSAAPCPGALLRSLPLLACVRGGEGSAPPQRWGVPQVQGRWGVTARLLLRPLVSCEGCHFLASEKGGLDSVGQNVYVPNALIWRGHTNAYCIGVGTV